jgi:membrane protease subunit (stomatin/prohibitin family)
MGLPSDLDRFYAAVIDWVERDDGTLAYHFPMKDREIPTGAQLTVRESQYAIFLDEGRFADVFGPGRYVLSTKTLPILTKIKQWDENFRSPFKSDVFFFSTREQLDQKWGTATAITMRDVELGPIRVRAHGTFSYRLRNPKVFFERVSGTCELYTAQQLDGQLRAIVVAALRGLLAGAQVPFIDMAANQETLSGTLFHAARDKFEEYGLELRTLTVQGISLPKELESHFDKAVQMRLVGDVQKYFLFQAAESLTQPKGENGDSGSNAIGVGIGLGLKLGNSLKGEKEAEGPAKPASLPSPTPAPADEEKDSEGGTLGTLAQLRDLHKKGLLSDDELEKKVAAVLKKKRS